MIRKIKIPEQFGSLYVCPAEHRARHMQHEAAHILLRQAVQEYAQEHAISVEEERPLFAYNDYGKPSFSDYPEIHFNLSHCDGLAVCLLSAHECGVDAEMKRTIRHKVVKRVFSTDEQKLLAGAEDPDWMFTRLWTLKESYVKAIGIGIGFPMQTVSFYPEENTIHSNRKDAEFYQISLEEHVISICILK